MIAIMITGTPIAKARPRFVKKGKYVSTYDPQETEEGRFMLLAKEQLRGAKLTGAIKLTCGFYMPIPKGTSKKKRLAMLNDQIYHTKKPDASNLLKFVEDCLNEMAWHDDSQIVRVHAEKYYSEEPRTYIQIEEIDGPKN